MMRLDRKHVETGIAEMWTALDHLAGMERDDAVAEAHRVELDLRRRLAEQERMDAAAPDLVKACQCAAEYALQMEEHFAANGSPNWAMGARGIFKICSSALDKAGQPDFLPPENEKP